MTPSARLRPALLLSLFLGAGAQAAAPLVIDVYHDPQCPCCKEWIKHMQDNGFAVKDHPQADVASVKEKLGVPYRLGSCHTAIFKGKFVEGHVPAAQVLELGKRADLAGVAVPAMPAGSPGMEMGSRRDAYQVIGVTLSGKEVVVARYPAAR